MHKVGRIRWKISYLTFFAFIYFFFFSLTHSWLSYLIIHIPLSLYIQSIYTIIYIALTTYFKCDNICSNILKTSPASCYLVLYSPTYFYTDASKLMIITAWYSLQEIIFTIDFDWNMSEVECEYFSNYSLPFIISYVHPKRS